MSRSSRGRSRTRAAAADRDRAPRALRSVAEHRPGRDQVAHHPRPGRDQAGPGHLRRREDRPVRHHPDGRSRRPGRYGRSTIPPRARSEVSAGRAGTPSTSTDPQVEIQKASGRRRQLSCRSPRVPRSSAGTRGVTSTGPRGRCRRPSTRWDSSSREPTGSSRPTTSRCGTVQYLAQTLGLKQSRIPRLDHGAHAETRPRRSSSSLPPDGRVSVFEVFRTAFDQTGTPMRLTVTVYPDRPESVHRQRRRRPDAQAARRADKA